MVYLAGGEKKKVLFWVKNKPSVCISVKKQSVAFACTPTINLCMITYTPN